MSSFFRPFTTYVSPRPPSPLRPNPGSAKWNKVIDTLLDVNHGLYMLFTFKNTVSYICAMRHQWSGIFHFHPWSDSIKPRLLFSHAGYASWGLSLFSVEFDPKCTGLYTPAKFLRSSTQCRIAVGDVRLQTSWYFRVAFFKDNITN